MNYPHKNLVIIRIIFLIIIKHLCTPHKLALLDEVFASERSIKFNLKFRKDLFVFNEN